MKKILGSLLFIILILIGSLFYEIYLNNQMYYQAPQAEFSEMLKPSGEHIYFLYTPKNPYVGSINKRVNKFYQATKDELFFQMINMNKPSNYKYAKAIVPKPGEDIYPKIKDVTSVDDLVITKVPAIIYVKDHKVVASKEGSASVIYLLNKILKEKKIDLQLSEL